MIISKVQKSPINESFGMLSRGFDVVAALRFLRLLTTPWENTNAYKAGIIDKEGKTILKRQDIPDEDKKYYTIFHRLVFNIKRLLQKTPIVGKSILTNYVAALLMLKEHQNFKHWQLEDWTEFLVESGLLNSDELYSQDLLSESTESVNLPVYIAFAVISTTNQIVENAKLIRNKHIPIPLFQANCLDNSVVFCGSDELIPVLFTEENTVQSVGFLDVTGIYKRTENKIFKRHVSVFDIDDETFSKFVQPKVKRKHWKTYISNTHEQYRNIRKSVSRGDLIVLRDSKGNTCSLRQTV